MSKSDIDLLRSTCIGVNAFHRDEHDAAKIMFLAFLFQKLVVQNYFSKSVIFTIIDLYRAV